MESQFNKHSRITLDEPRSIYYAGQVLSGNIECDLGQPITYTVINVLLIGEANVHWTEQETEEYNGVRRSVNKEYKAKESYFNIIQCVAGGSGVVNLRPGNHKFPFQYQIPPNVPSSFKGEQGSISYKVIAYFDRVPYPDPNMERDQMEKEFEVVAPFDLNSSDVAKSPLNLEFEEMYSCCCSSSPLNIKIDIPASGYCPGQEIPINISTNNDSNEEVKNITIKLIKKACYRSKEPASEYIPPEEVLQVVKTGAFLSNTKRVVKYGLKVPDMIAPYLGNCSIIDVGFFLKVTIKMSGCTENLEDEEEISIGIIPLTSTLLGSSYEHPMKIELPQKIRFEDLQNWIPNNIMTSPNETAVTNYPNAYYPSAPYPNRSPSIGAPQNTPSNPSAPVIRNHTLYPNSPYSNRSPQNDLPQNVEPQNMVTPSHSIYRNSPYSTSPYPNRAQKINPENPIAAPPMTPSHNSPYPICPYPKESSQSELPQNKHQENPAVAPMTPNNTTYPDSPYARCPYPTDLPQNINPGNPTAVPVIPNETSYPNSSYPNSYPFPNAESYPNSSPTATTERIPLASIRTNNIGFVVPNTLPRPSHQENVPPYPTTPNNSSAPSAPPAST